MLRTRRAHYVLHKATVAVALLPREREEGAVKFPLAYLYDVLCRARCVPSVNQPSVQALHNMPT